MTTLFISRHPGAREWAAEEGFTVDYLFDHLSIDFIRPGDVVIGTLPVHLAAEVCARGGRYLHLTLALPPAKRGGEFSAAEMRRFGAHLQEHRVIRITP
jgi:CRISPR-associated protein Csx16